MARKSQTETIEPRETRSRTKRGAEEKNEVNDKEGAKKKVKGEATKKNTDDKKVANGDGDDAKEGFLKVGDHIPKDLSLLDENDNSVRVIDALGTKGAVFFIYPRANTPGCTTQACSFRDSHADFEKEGFKVYALSRDPPKAQLSWKEKHNFPFNLLCDPNQELIKPLGASKSATSVNRSHFVVDQDGKLLHASIGIKPATSMTDSLEFIRGLSKSE